MGFQVTFSKYADEIDRFASSSISSRVQDLHEAFRDPNVKAILTTLGGYNSNGLLKHLDYDLIRENPKFSAAILTLLLYITHFIQKQVLLHIQVLTSLHLEWRKVSRIQPITFLNA